MCGFSGAFTFADAQKGLATAKYAFEENGGYSTTTPFYKDQFWWALHAGDGIWALDPAGPEKAAKPTRYENGVARQLRAKLQHNLYGTASVPLTLQISA